MALKKQQLFQKRRLRVRNKLRAENSGRPRLSVHRTGKHIYAQIIDDAAGKTLASASTLGVKGTTANIDAAKTVGSNIADAAKKAGVTNVVFDRGGFLYHGRGRKGADAARDALGHEHHDARARHLEGRAERVAHFLLRHVEVRHVAGHEHVWQPLVTGLHFADQRPAASVHDINLATFALLKLADGFLHRLAVHAAAIDAQPGRLGPLVAGQRHVVVPGKHRTAPRRRSEVAGKLQRQRRPPRRHRDRRGNVRLARRQLRQLDHPQPKLPRDRVPHECRLRPGVFLHRQRGLGHGRERGRLCRVHRRPVAGSLKHFFHLLADTGKRIANHERDFSPQQVVAVGHVQAAARLDAQHHLPRGHLQRLGGQPVGPRALGVHIVRRDIDIGPGQPALLVELELVRQHAAAAVLEGHLRASLLLEFPGRFLDRFFDAGRAVDDQRLLAAACIAVEKKHQRGHQRQGQHQQPRAASAALPIFVP